MQAIWDICLGIVKIHQLAAQVIGVALLELNIEQSFQSFEGDQGRGFLIAAIEQEAGGSGIVNQVIS